ncbi:MAG: SOS response-associated peptidase [bacterium]|nr:SOS response-associated peptidase [bacterium]
MCGRYSLVAFPKELQERFNVKKIEGTITPRFNVAPAQQLPLVTTDHPDRIILGEWGIVPAWMRAEVSPRRLINARAETITEKKTFKKAIEQQRCLIIADGFYEWAELPNENHKQPYRITRKDEAPFAMAGIYKIRRNKSKEEILEFAIITVEANSMMARIHNRMPAMLLPEDEMSWLDSSIPVIDAIKMLKPFPANKMIAYPVSLDVNSPANDNPEVMKPLKELPSQKPLL